MDIRTAINLIEQGVSPPDIHGADQQAIPTPGHALWLKLFHIADAEVGGSWKKDAKAILTKAAVPQKDELLSLLRSAKTGDDFLRMSKRVLLREIKTPPFLFHGTGLFELVQIVAKNVMIAGTDDEGVKAVFTSPNMQEAMRYTTSFTGPDGGIIVLDTRKMAAKGISIQPHFYYDSADEVEFTIKPNEYGDYLSPIVPFIAAILIREANLAPLSNIPRALAMMGEDCDCNSRDIKKFLAFPRLRRV